MAAKNIPDNLEDRFERIKKQRQQKRESAKSQTKAGADAGAKEPDKKPAESPKGIKAFEALIKSTKDNFEAIDMLRMLFRLLRNYHAGYFYIPEGNQQDTDGNFDFSSNGEPEYFSMLEEFNLDPENLQEILQAVFAYKIGGSSVSKNKIIEWLEEKKIVNKEKKNRPVKDIVYYDLFGFNEKTNAKEIKRKYDQLVSNINEMDQLRMFSNPNKEDRKLRQPPVTKNVAAAGKEFEKNPPQSREDFIKLLLKYQLPISQKRDRSDPMDTSVIKRMLNEVYSTGYQPPEHREVQTNRGRVEQTINDEQPAQPAPQVDYQSIRNASELATAFKFLNALERAGRAPFDEYQGAYKSKFKDQGRDEIWDFIDDQYPNLGLLFMSTTAKQSNDDFLDVIAKSFELTGNPDSLAIKVKEITDLLMVEYSDVVRVPQEPAEEPEEPEAEPDEEDETESDDVETHFNASPEEENEVEEPAEGGESTESAESGESTESVADTDDESDSDDESTEESDENDEDEQSDDEPEPQTTPPNILESQEALNGLFNLDEIDDDDDEL